jgi:hypothetical protein
MFIVMNRFQKSLYLMSENHTEISEVEMFRIRLINFNRHVTLRNEIQTGKLR